jgi:prolyl-tRNA editing enzyme YbaK/EbsC (Cys-tRNA(Pro) deacylase)/cold shock CspA family protein/ribosome-associated translation inhibitor RaiA
MILPIQIEFRNMHSSSAVEQWIRKRAAKLDRFFDRIIACRVLVEIPHLRHRSGSAYLVRIDLTVPGREMVVKRQPVPASSLRAAYRVRKALELEAPHKNLRLAIHDACKKAERQLQNCVHRMRREVKTHEVLPKALVSKLFWQKGYGFLVTLDEREIYFHKDSVLGKNFDKLAEGTLVTFIEEKGEKGPQASTVRLVGTSLPGKSRAGTGSPTQGSPTMSISTRIKNHLDQSKTPYVLLTHSQNYTAQGTASTMHLSGQEIAKTVVVKAGNQYCLVALPASRRVSLEKLGDVLSLSVQLATESEFSNLFPDCDVGAMPPLGEIYNLPVYVDESLAADEEIIFNAGTHQDAIRMKFTDFAKLAQPMVRSFAA